MAARRQWSDLTNEQDLDLLITRCYTWGSALRSLTAQPAGQPAYAS
jgi:hypothetical protein